NKMVITNMWLKTLSQGVVWFPKCSQRVCLFLCGREDDDINDVASMAGVNLREENARNLTSTVGSVVQSCQDQLFLSPHDLLTSILHTGEPLGVTDVGPDVVAVVSHATQEYLRELVEKISAVAKHRREDSWHDRVSDVCSQLRFLEEIEKLKKKRRDEEEKEKLLRVACVCLQLQQMEEAQLQQKEANLTALAAIGPRKKRVLDQSNGQVCLPTRPGTQKVTRVVLKDLLVCMEQDPVLHRSLTFYKAMLFTV
uniref:Transcription initiation factor TFIID component TAF4 C-terminal domain-containing protein n=1 Tax=Oryzias latipes TaxID=8090 RepID=H2LD18_ORYLA